MKCSIPEISWHNREPVLSVDFQLINTTNNDFYRLATGGSDSLVLIWKLKILLDGQVDISVLSELTRHQRSVNCVKWSPNGELLASADDDANIILWQLRTDNIPSLDEKENEFEEKWNAFKILRGHKEDVYDLCWSPQSDKLLSGSVDNTAILWDVLKGKSEHIIKDHKGFIQGVAWNPKSDFLATLCSDRFCRVFTGNGRRVRARIGRGRLPVDESSEFYEKDVKYFHDDTFKTYFRRLNFSPDGSLLLVPSGAVETNEKKNAMFGTFVFTLDSLSNPVCVLPSGKECSIVVKCCPILFELREKGPKPFINLPYRMIIAVATDSDVILYDTQQLAPCVHLQNIHYTRLTDLTWSVDGLLLAASSTDGFITLVTFEEGELGTPYVKEESDLEESFLNINGCETLQQVEIETNNKVKVMEEVEKLEEKRKKPTILDQWTKLGNKRKNGAISEEIKDEKKVRNDLNSCEKEIVVEMETEVAIVDPKLEEVKKKRITPMLISKNKPTKEPVMEMPKVEEKNEVKAKRRIQPIKIGNAEKPKVHDVNSVLTPSELNKTEEKTMNVDVARDDQNIDSRTNTVNAKSCETPKSDKIGKTAESSMDVVEVTDVPKNEKPCEALKNDEQKMAAPTTPKCTSGTVENVRGTPNGKVSPPTSNTKKTLARKSQTTPHNEKTTTDKTSSKKKSQANTLLNYLKPIAKTPTSDSRNTQKVEIPKTVFKPQKLFSKDTEESQSSNEVINAKIEVKHEILDLPFAEETTTEIPDDFVLKVDEDVIIINDDPIQSFEKENGCKKQEHKVDVKATVVDVKKQELEVPLKAEAKRRVPLITLSSPKNKKPKTAE